MKLTSEQSERIKLYLYANKIKQTYIADFLHVSLGSVSRKFSGEQGITDAELKLIEDAIRHNNPLLSLENILNGPLSLPVNSSNHQNPHVELFHTYVELGSICRSLDDQQSYSLRKKLIKLIGEYVK